MCFKPRYSIARDSHFPCGSCPKCVARRVSAWSFRMLEEEKVSSSAHFVTLTYDTRYVPFIWSDEWVRLNLYPRDLCLFFKRLRKAHGSGHRPIKYYAVGEYGGITWRPHYHIIMFNAQLELIDSAWNLGRVHYGDVTGGSIGYCLKYMSKHKKKSKAQLRFRHPEFAVMSKGLGISYIENEVNAAWHIGDMVNRMYVTVDGGKKIAMPRYYKEKLYYENEKSAIREAFTLKVHDKMVEKMDRQGYKEFRNEMAAIDASYDRMYLSSLKSKI